MYQGLPGDKHQELTTKHINMTNQQINFLKDLGVTDEEINELETAFKVRKYLDYDTFVRMIQMNIDYEFNDIAPGVHDDIYDAVSYAFRLSNPELYNAMRSVGTTRDVFYYWLGAYRPWMGEHGELTGDQIAQQEFDMIEDRNLVYHFTCSGRYLIIDGHN